MNDSFIQFLSYKADAIRSALGNTDCRYNPFYQPIHDTFHFVTYTNEYSIQTQGKYIFTLNKNIDLLKQLTLKITFPSLNTTKKKNISWINNIVFYFIKSIDILVNGIIIDSISGDWLYIWSELWLDANKHKGFSTLTGKISNNNIGNCFYKTHTFYVPLPFWFSVYKSYLTLLYVHHFNHEVSIQFQFRNVSSDMWICKEKKEPMIQEPHIKASLMIESIYLEETLKKAHIDKVPKPIKRYLIERHKKYTFSIRAESTSFNADLSSFHFPIKALIWTFRLNQKTYDFTTKSVLKREKDWFRSAKILVDGIEILSEQDPLFFRVHQYYTNSSIIPNNYIYLYSFTTQLTQYQYTTFLDASAFKSIHLNFHLRSIPKNYILNVYVVYNNFLEVNNVGQIRMLI